MWEMTLSLTAVKYQYSSAEKATLVQRNIKIPLDEIFNDSSLCLTIEKSGREAGRPGICCPDQSWEKGSEASKCEK